MTVITLDRQVAREAFVHRIAARGGKAEGRRRSRAIGNGPSHVRQGGRAVDVGDSEAVTVQVKGSARGNDECLAALRRDGDVTNRWRDGQRGEERILTSVQDDGTGFD